MYVETVERTWYDYDELSDACKRGAKDTIQEIYGDMHLDAFWDSISFELEDVRKDFGIRQAWNSDWRYACQCRGHVFELVENAHTSSAEKYCYLYDAIVRLNKDLRKIILAKAIADYYGSAYWTCDDDSPNTVYYSNMMCVFDSYAEKLEDEAMKFFAKNVDAICESEYNYIYSDEFVEYILGDEFLVFSPGGFKCTTLDALVNYREVAND